MKRVKSVLWIFLTAAVMSACADSSESNTNANDPDVDETRESNVVQPAENPINATAGNDDGSAPDTARVQRGLDTGVYHGNATEKKLP